MALIGTDQIGPLSRAVRRSGAHVSAPPERLSSGSLFPDVGERCSGGRAHMLTRGEAEQREPVVSLLSIRPRGADTCSEGSTFSMSRIDTGGHHPQGDDGTLDVALTHAQGEPTGAFLADLEARLQRRSSLLSKRADTLPSHTVGTGQLAHHAVLPLTSERCRDKRHKGGRRKGRARARYGGWLRSQVCTIQLYRLPPHLRTCGHPATPLRLSATMTGAGSQSSREPWSSLAPVGRSR